MGVSGGKDSVALLVLLAELRKYNDKSFDVEAITIDMGLGMDYSPIAQLCEQLDVKFNLIKTENASLKDASRNGSEIWK